MNLKRLLRKRALLLTGLLAYSTLAAQDGKPEKFNNFAIQTPTAFAFSKINNVPLSLFTGQINVNVPLFKKKMGAIEFDMSAQYIGGGGVQADNQTGSLAKGWMLKTGGIITRHKRGIPDDFNHNSSSYNHTKGILYGPGLSSHTDGDYLSEWWQTLHQYEEGAGDGQHDIFEFNFQGRSGKFYIGKNWEILCVPDSKLKIEAVKGTQPTVDGMVIGTTITGFMITDENGFRYSFNAMEFKRDPDFNWDTYLGSTLAKNFIYVTSWQLTRIDAPYSTDFIEFQYLENRNTVENLFFTSLEYYEKRSDKLIGTHHTVSGRRNISDLYLKKVVFSDQTSVELDYYSYDQPMLNKIRLQDNNSSLKRSLVFSYQGFTRWDGYRFVNREGNDNSFIGSPLGLHRNIMFLESIREMAADGTLGATHVFDYYMQQEQVEFLKGIDHWGFHNGKPSADGTLIPVYTDQYSSIADRSADLNYARYGALRKIKYPTGGLEEFEYQLNDIGTPSGTAIRGGLRLSKRTLRNTQDPAGDVVHEFKYVNADGTSSGFLGELPELHYERPVYQNDGSWPANPNVRRMVSYDMSVAINPVSYVEGSPIGYRRVEETYGGGAGVNGKVIHEFSDLSVTSLWDQNDAFPYRPADRPNWVVGLPTKTTVINKSGNVVKEVINRYNFIQAKKTTENFRSLHLSKPAEIHNPLNGNVDQTKPIFRVKVYYPVFGRTELSEVEENIYSDNSIKLTALKQFTYDPNTYAVRNITIKKAGAELVERNYYPYDYNLGAGNPITILNTLGITGPIIRKDVWGKAFGSSQYTQVSGKVNGYAAYNGSQVLASKIYEYESENPQVVPAVTDPPPYTFTQLLPNTSYRETVSFHSYSPKARLLEYTNRGDVREAIVSDELDRIAAKVINTPADEVAFTSFESVYGGGWAYTGATQAEATAPGGKQGFNIANAGVNGIRKTGLQTAKTYIVSYWLKGAASATVVGSTLLPGTRSANGWTHFRHQFTGRAEATVTGAGIIDELRVYPADAMMHSYTYSYLDGVVSASDETDKLLSYEYDKFGRLTSIRNEARNILKQYAYQTATPEFNPTPSWQSTGQTRCVPCPQNTVYNSGVQEMQYKDLNPASTTFNTLVWKPWLTCETVVWQATGNVRCLKDANQQNTGEHELEQKSMNPCSPSYNTLRWIAGTPSPTVCPDTRATHVKLCKRNIQIIDDMEYADIVLTFYTTAACNVPKNVSYVSVKIREKVGGTQITDSSYPCTGFSVTIATQVFIANVNAGYPEREYEILPDPSYSNVTYMQCEDL